MTRRSALPTRARGETVGALTGKRQVWRLSYGERPHVVTLRENRAPGAALVWDYAGQRDRSLGEVLRVRTADGKGGWTWDSAAVARAEKLAKDRHHARALELSREDAFASAVKAEVREFGDGLRSLLPAGFPLARLDQQLDRLVQRIVALPTADGKSQLTVEEGFALYHDVTTGGLPKSPAARRSHRIARETWTAALRDARTGASMAWNDITLADVEAVAFRTRKSGRVDSGRRLVTNLTTVHHWLRKKRRMRELESPTEGFDFEAYLDGYEPNRPRYTVDEMRRLVAVRDEVDPRFALLVALIIDRGDRKGAYLKTMRSDLNCRMTREPDPSKAPYGWLRLPALKGGRAPLIYLTARQRTAIDGAFAGYLRLLEPRYQADGADYPLFPGARLRGRDEQVVEPDVRRAYSPLGERSAELMLHDAERRASPPVEHIAGRAWHGFRRVVSHALAEKIGKEQTADALGWKGTGMLDNTYMEEERHEAAARVREAMEG